MRTDGKCACCVDQNGAVVKQKRQTRVKATDKDHENKCKETKLGGKTNLNSR